MKKYIGIDLGGTKIEAIRFNGKKVEATCRVATKSEAGYKQVLANIVTAAASVRTPDVCAVGLAIPGIVHIDRIIGSGVLGSILNGKKVAGDLSKILKLPVVMQNDAKLFALAEWQIGAAKGKRHVVGLIIGTGVGAGIIIDGNLLHGAVGAAGEVGEAPYRESTYEHYVAGPAYYSMYHEAGGKENNISTKEIMTRPRPDKAISAAREQTLDATAHLLATIISAYNPEVIVIGGGVSLSLDIKRLKERTKQYTFPALFRSCKIVRHKISDSAGAIGAAMLAHE